MEEAGDHPFFVEPGAACEIQRVDTVELVIFAVIDQAQDGLGDRPPRRLYLPWQNKLGTPAEFPRPINQCALSGRSTCRF